MLKFPQWLSLICALGVVQPPGLRELTKKSYLDLLENEVQVDAAAVAQFRKALEGEKRSEEKRLQAEEKEIKKRLDDAHGKLKAMNRSGAPPEEDAKTTDRRKLHCEILHLERDLSLKRTERERGLPIACENRIAKAELVEHWPGKRAEIREAVRSGRARTRKFGDVADIGVREISQDQAKDIKLGQDVIREMKVYGLMPPNWQDDKVREYVEKLAQEIASHSDLRVPLNLTLLHSQEINAFMLPGGYLFVNTGLLEKAETESELAGVIAHEISHAAARHGHRLMKRATIANIAYQAAQVAALIFTGGVAGVGTYYAMQYGFYGLGMVLELTLLGVSREFEEEADQLGAQYAWRAGYDPRGFITFFDKMAAEEGYIRSISFFRTHPPFYERIIATFSEVEYLPRKADLKFDSTRFQDMKRQLKAVLKSAPGDPKKQPKLRRFPECDDEEPSRSKTGEF